MQKFKSQDVVTRSELVDIIARQREAKLLEEIGSEPQNKILIFVETKRKCDELTRYVDTI